MRNFKVISGLFMRQGSGKVLHHGVSGFHHYIVQHIRGLNMPRTTIGQSWRVVAQPDAGFRVLRGILRFREIFGALKAASRWAITRQSCSIGVRGMFTSRVFWTI